ncbi:MAG: CDP-alcohol phosphatidyltransferase family protein [Myxococcota bacterium]
MTHSTPTSPTPDGFGGATKTGRWLCAEWEKRFVARWVDRVPPWIETWHLTLATLAWCALAVAGGALAAHADWRWLSLVSLALALQYATDLFDGAVGRHRDTGLVRWGFYMDHLLDFVFLCSLFVAWGLALPEAQNAWGLALLGLAGAGMASSFLAFAATGEFRISCGGVGPTELRLAAIAANQALVAWGPPRLDLALPAAVAVAAAALAWVVVANHRALWALDLELRARSAEASGEGEAHDGEVGTHDRGGDAGVGR